MCIRDRRQTAQGYADESAWARGQAWALYGYTTCYRYTKDKKYLDQAQKVYNFIFNNKNLPEDLVPYWDYDACLLYTSWISAVKISLGSSSSRVAILLDNSQE